MKKETIARNKKVQAELIRLDRKPVDLSDDDAPGTTSLLKVT